MTAADGKPYKRDPNDFYPTPPEVCRAFVAAELPFLPLKIWEPAVGDGALARHLPGEVIGSDLVDRGFGTPRVDFLMERKKWADALVTNAPFQLNDQFMLHAFDLDISYIAILHPTIFLNTGMWRDIWHRRHPQRVYTLTWRPDMFGIGSPDQRCSYAWSVWDKKAPDQACRYLPMHRGL
jgi:hypothetical protein